MYTYSIASFHIVRTSAARRAMSVFSSVGSELNRRAISFPILATRRLLTQLHDARILEKGIIEIGKISRRDKRLHVS